MDPAAGRGLPCAPSKGTELRQTALESAGFWRINGYVDQGSRGFNFGLQCHQRWSGPNGTADDGNAQSLQAHALDPSGPLETTAL